MDKYLETLGIFYDEKMKYLTGKDKYIRCQSCDTQKTFQEGKDALILSCGSDKCDPQIIIQLPKYLHFETSINKLKKELNDEYNWDTLKHFLDVEKNAIESEEKRKKINDEIDRIENLFFKKNMEMKERELQKFYDSRISKTKECKNIMKNIKSETISEEKRKEELRNYINLVQEINKEYEEILELVKDIDPFLMDKEPEIIIQHDDVEYKKEKKKKMEMEGEGVGDYKEGMKVSWMYKEKKKFGTVKELKGKGALIEDEKGKQRIRALKGLTIED
tara:strand:+ start:714 stop:1541 length:828 start_codon:yes stop_codon:yes gene_type:complete